MGLLFSIYREKDEMTETAAKTTAPGITVTFSPAAFVAARAVISNAPYDGVNGANYDAHRAMQGAYDAISDARTRAEARLSKAKEAHVTADGAVSLAYNAFMTAKGNRTVAANEIVLAERELNRCIKL